MIAVSTSSLLLIDGLKQIKLFGVLWDKYAAERITVFTAHRRCLLKLLLLKCSITEYQHEFGYAQGLNMVT